MSNSPDALRAYADLHCHLLPSWDDGARSLDIALEMGRQAAASGLQKIVVTPHVGRTFSFRDEPDAATIPTATAELQKSLDEHKIPIQLVAGAEILLDDPAIAERILNEPHLTFGGARKYCLIEAPGSVWPPYAERVVVELARHGITSIIAHPERLSDVQREKDLLKSPLRGALAQGALLQLTARCLQRRAESEQRKCALRLLQSGAVSLLASDAHNEMTVFPGDVALQLCDIVGEEAAHQILDKNPRRVLSGEFARPPRVEIPPTEPSGWRKIAALFTGPSSSS